MCAPESAPRGPGVVHLAEADAEAIRNLTQQAKGRRDALAKLTRLIRDRIKVESAAVANLDKELERLLSTAVEELFGNIDALTPVERRALRAVTDEDIGAVLDSLGLDDIRDQWAGAQLDLLEQANRAPTLGGLEPARVSPRSATVRALLDAESDNLWGDQVRRPAVSTIRRGFQAAADGRPAADLVPEIQRQLGTTRSRAQTEARTQVAEFSRTVTAAAAQEAGAEWYIYRGPDDAITRPFCDELVGKAYALDQIEQLNNAQTLVSPLYSGGGYNCRHSWLPVSDGFIDRHGIDRGTMAQVRAANAAAKRGR